MKKVFTIITLIFLVSNHSYAQRLNKKAKRSPYISFLSEGNKFVENGYHYQIEKTPTGKMVYKQFYLTKKVLTHYRTYDSKFKKLDGPYFDWFDNGNLWKAGHFEKGVPSGVWKEYVYGKVNSYGNYENGLKTGIWTDVDSLGNTTATYEYLDGLPNGKFQQFDSLGVLENVGIMENGKIISQTKKEELEDNWKVVEKMPQFPGCESIQDLKQQKKCADRIMLEFIYKRIKYPRLARQEGIEGTARIQFVIDKDGRVTDIKVKRGICREIEAECLRLIKKFLIWNPGEQNGETVRVLFNLPIRFRLE